MTECADAHSFFAQFYYYPIPVCFALRMPQYISSSCFPRVLLALTVPQTALRLVTTSGVLRSTDQESFGIALYFLPS